MRCVITVIPTGHMQGVLQWTHWASKFSKKQGGTHPVRVQRWTPLASRHPRQRSSFSWDHTWCLRQPRPPSHSSGIHRCPNTNKSTKNKSFWYLFLASVKYKHTFTQYLRHFKMIIKRFFFFVNQCNEQTWDVFGCFLCSFNVSKAFKNMSSVSIIKCERVNLLGPCSLRGP